MGRSPCCSKEGLNRGAWTAMEDKILSAYIKAHGEGKWRSLPKRAGLKRCGKSCRLRWLNYLRPDIKRGNISRDEEELIIRLHKLLGNRWSLISGRLPGRTDNEIKNYWNTTLGKKVGAQSSSEPSKQSPTRKSRAQKRPIPSPAAIRTKALRCTKVVVPSISPPSVLQADPIHSKNPPQDSDNSKVDCATDRELHPTYSSNGLDLLKFGCDDELGASGDGPNRNNNCSINDLDLGTDYLLPGYNEALFKDWTAIDFLEDNGNIDLGCLASLLNNEDWACEEDR